MLVNPITWTTGISTCQILPQKTRIQSTSQALVVLKETLRAILQGRGQCDVYRRHQDKRPLGSKTVTWLGNVTQWPLYTRALNAGSCTAPPPPLPLLEKLWTLWPSQPLTPLPPVAVEPEQLSLSLTLTSLFFPTVSSSLYFLEKGILFFFNGVLIITA